MKVDISMLDSQVAILENAVARYVTTGEIPGPLGSRHPSIAPFAVFAAKDGHVVIAAGNNALFRKVAETLEHPELADDPRYASNPLRMQNWKDLHDDLEEALSARSAKDWLVRLEAAGVPCGPLNNVAAVMADPQVAARNMIVSADDPDLGPVRMPGNPVKLSAYEDPPTRPAAPDLDADRAAILAWLGLD